MAQKGALKYLLAGIGAAFIWGFLTIPLKHLHAHGYRPEQILYYRVLISFVILWLYIIFFRTKALKTDMRVMRQMSKKNRQMSYLWLLLTGIFITTNWFTYIYVVNNIGVKVAGFGYLICPLITAASGFLLLKEKLSKVKITGIAVAVVSITILSTGSLSQAFWSVLVAISYSIYLVIQRLIPQFDKINTLGVQLLISTVMLMPFFVYQFNGLPAQTVFWEDVIIVAIVFTIIPLLLSLYALTGLPSSTVGITIYINPVLTFAVAFFYFHENFEHSQLLGYTILFISVIVFNWDMISSAFKDKKIKTSASV